MGPSPQILSSHIFMLKIVIVDFPHSIQTTKPSLGDILSKLPPLLY